MYTLPSCGGQEFSIGVTPDGRAARAVRAATAASWRIPSSLGRPPASTRDEIPRRSQQDQEQWNRPRLPVEVHLPGHQRDAKTDDDKRAARMAGPTESWIRIIHRGGDAWRISAHGHAQRLPQHGHPRMTAGEVRCLPGHTMRTAGEVRGLRWFPAAGAPGWRCCPRRAPGHFASRRRPRCP